MNEYSNSITIAKVKDGQSGTSYYTYIKYSENSSGNPMVDTPTDATLYIGIYTGTASSAPSSYSSYTWSRYTGKDGTSVTISQIEYGTSSSASTNPSNWSTTAPVSLTKGTWLWVKTTYNDNSTATTKSYIGTDGDDGVSVYVQSATKVGDTTTVVIVDTDGNENTLTIKDGADGTDGAPGAPGANGLNGYVHTAWANSADGSVDFDTTVSAGKMYLGVYTDNTQSDSQDYTKYSWSLIKGADGQDGQDGQNGTDGINNATVYLYQRATSTPSVPNGNLTYTFATKTISGSALGNWQQTIPTGTNLVWLTIATANSSNATDTISSNEWTTPVRLDGKDGDAVIYEVETSNPNILRYISQEGDSRGSVFFSVDHITYSLNKITDGVSTKVNLSEYTTNIDWYGLNGNIDNFYQLLSRLQGYTESSSTLVNLLTVGITTENTQSIQQTTFNFNTLLSYIVDNVSGNDYADIEKFNKFKKDLNENSSCFLIRFYKKAQGVDYPTGSSNLIIAKEIDYGQNLPEEFARFEQTAVNIQAAVDETKLTFDANGLTIQDGGISIIGKDNEILLSYNQIQDALKIKGNGVFSGRGIYFLCKGEYKVINLYVKSFSIFFKLISKF